MCWTLTMIIHHPKQRYHRRFNWLIDCFISSAWLVIASVVLRVKLLAHRHRGNSPPPFISMREWRQTGGGNNRGGWTRKRLPPTWTRTEFALRLSFFHTAQLSPVLKLSASVTAASVTAAAVAFKNTWSFDTASRNPPVARRVIGPGYKSHMQWLACRP